MIRRNTPEGGKRPDESKTETGERKIDYRRRGGTRRDDVSDLAAKAIQEAEAAAIRDFEAQARGEVGVPGLDAARRAVFDRDPDVDSVQSGQQQASVSALEQLNQLEMQNQIYRDFFGKYQRHLVEQQARASRS